MEGIEFIWKKLFKKKIVPIKKKCPVFPFVGGGKLGEKEGCFGVVEHYYYKLEYQARGAPHIHYLLWIKDAPVLKKDGSNKTEVKKYIDEHITCAIPGDDNPELKDLVVKYQGRPYYFFLNNKNRNVIVSRFNMILSRCI